MTAVTLSPLRVSDALSRAMDKARGTPLGVAATHSASSSFSNQQLAPEAPVNNLDRDTSPGHAPSRSGSNLELSELVPSTLKYPDPRNNDDGEQTPVTTIKSLPRPPLVAFETCPSFQEQRGTKPVFFERHGTFQRMKEEAPLSTVQEVDGAEASDAERESAAVSVPASAPASPAGTPASSSAPASTSSRSPYLPSWDISSSGLWSAIEEGLLRTVILPELYASVVAQAPGIPFSAAAAAAVPPATTFASSGPSASTPTHPVSTATHASPFATHRLTTVFSPDISPSPSQRHDHHQDHQDRLPQPTSSNLQGPSASTGAATGASPSPSPSPLARWASVARTLMRSTTSGASPLAAPSPRGLGPALTPSMSLSRARSLLRHDSLGLGSSFGRVGQGSSFGHGSSFGRSSFGRGSGGAHEHDSVIAATLASVASHAAAVFSSGGAAVAGVAALSSATAAVTVSAAAAVQLGGHAVLAGGDLVMNRLQNAVVSTVASITADAVLGPAASASHRHQLKVRLRATAAGASILWFMLSHAGMSDCLASVDFEHDFVTSAKLMLDVVTNGPQLMENCRELMQIGMAVGMGVAQRNSACSGGGGGGGADCDVAAEAAAAVEAAAEGLEGMGSMGGMEGLMAMAECVAQDRG